MFVFVYAKPNLSVDSITVVRFINCQVDRWINTIPLSTVGVAHGETGSNATILTEERSRRAQCSKKTVQICRSIPSKVTIKIKLILF